MSAIVTSEAGWGGTVGGDGAGESWSFTTHNTTTGENVTTYVYAVYMPDRFSDWEEREDPGNPWDIETVDMSDDNVGEYLWPSLNGYATEGEADDAACALAEHYRLVTLLHGADW